MDLNKHFKCPEFTCVLKIGTGVIPGHCPAFTQVMFCIYPKVLGKNETHKICLTPQRNEFRSMYRNNKTQNLQIYQTWREKYKGLGILSHFYPTGLYMLLLSPAYLAVFLFGLPISVLFKGL